MDGEAINPDDYIPLDVNVPSHAKLETALQKLGCKRLGTYPRYRGGAYRCHRCDPAKCTRTTMVHKDDYDLLWVGTCVGGVTCDTRGAGKCDSLLIPVIYGPLGEVHFDEAFVVKVQPPNTPSDAPPATQPAKARGSQDTAASGSKDTRGRASGGRVTRPKKRLESQDAHEVETPKKRAKVNKAGAANTPQAAAPESSEAGAAKTLRTRHAAAQAPPAAVARRQSPATSGTRAAAARRQSPATTRTPASRATRATRSSARHHAEVDEPAAGAGTGAAETRATAAEAESAAVGQDAEEDAEENSEDDADEGGAEDAEVDAEQDDVAMGDIDENNDAAATVDKRAAGIGATSNRVDSPVSAQDAEDADVGMDGYDEIESAAFSAVLPVEEVPATAPTTTAADLPSTVTPAVQPGRASSSQPSAPGTGMPITNGAAPLQASAERPPRVPSAGSLGLAASVGASESINMPTVTQGQAAIAPQSSSTASRPEPPTPKATPVSAAATAATPSDGPTTISEAVVPANAAVSSTEPRPSTLSSSSGGPVPATEGVISATAVPTSTIVTPTVPREATAQPCAAAPSGGTIAVPENVVTTTTVAPASTRESAAQQPSHALAGTNPAISTTAHPSPCTSHNSTSQPRISGIYDAYEKMTQALREAPNVIRSLLIKQASTKTQFENEKQKAETDYADAITKADEELEKAKRRHKEAKQQAEARRDAERDRLQAELAGIDKYRPIEQYASSVLDGNSPHVQVEDESALPNDVLQVLAGQAPAKLVNDHPELPDVVRNLYYEAARLQWARQLEEGLSAYVKNLIN